YRAPAAQPDGRGRGDRDSDGQPADWGAVLPRLQRFYGGTPRQWLEDTPVALVRAHLRMMRRIEAEERLAAIADRAAAAATMPQADRTRHAGRLKRAASGAEQARPARASAATLAGMGIGVR